MILRIARFTVDRDDEDAVVELLRSQAGTARRPDGLDDIILALSRSADSSAEFVAVSLWTDMAALMQALGPAWDEPGGISGNE